MEVETSKCQCWPPARIGHIGVMLGRYLLIWGGYNYQLVMQEEDYITPLHLWMYDTELALWYLKTVKRPDNPHEHFMVFDSPQPGVSGSCAIVVHTTLYIFGGHTMEGTINDLYALDFNPSRDLRWRKVDAVGKCPTPRDKCTGWSYGDKLFYFGGFALALTDGEYLNENGFQIPDAATWSYPKCWTNQLVVFDLISGEWSNPCIKGETIQPRAAHSGVKIGSHVYIFGGRCLNRRMNDLFSLDLTSLTATRLLPSGAEPSGRSWQIFSPVSPSHILLYGGFTTAQDVCDDSWLFDVDQNKWEKLDHIPSNHPLLWHTGCTSQDGDVLIFGGLASNILNSNEQHVLSEELLKIRVSPKSLKRLSLERVLHYQNELGAMLHILPRQLKDILTTRISHLESCSTSSDSGDRSQTHQGVAQNQNVTCAIS